MDVEFQTHPIVNIKRNIIFALESRKKNGVPIVENVPIRMRVIFASQRIEFTTNYQIPKDMQYLERVRDVSCSAALRVCGIRMFAI